MGRRQSRTSRRTAARQAARSITICRCWSCESPDDETIRAIYVSYACHCVTLSNNKISGDWAGYAAGAIERNHPGAVALVSIGCGSDSNPSSGVTGDNVAAARRAGRRNRRRSRAAAERAAQAGHAGRSPRRSAASSCRLNKLPTRDELAAMAKQQTTPEGYNAKCQLAKLDRGEPLQTAIDYPIQTWTFGDSPGDGLPGRRSVSSTTRCG